MEYALNCADLQSCGVVLRCGSRGGAKGVCHTPLHIYLCNQQATYTVYMITQKPKLSAFPECPKNYIGHRKNYVLCRKNYIRHNPNYIRPFLAHLQHAENQAFTNREQNNITDLMSALCYIIASRREILQIMCFAKAKNNFQTVRTCSKLISGIFAFLTSLLTFSET